MTGQQLKNSILQMAVQGKLVPQDPNDEPASVLLERIRKEKEQLIKEGKIKKEKNPSYIFRGADNLPYEKVGKNEPVCIADEVPFEIPESWEWVRLKNCCIDIFSGKSPKYVKSETAFHIIGQAANQNTGLDFSQCKYTDADFWNSMDEKYFLKKYDVLLNTLGNGTLGRSGIVTDLPYPTLTDGHLFIFRTNEEVVGWYLYLYLQYRKPEIEKSANGSTNQTFLNLTKTMEWLVPLPSKDEQIRIVEKYKSLTPILEAYSRAYNNCIRLNDTFPELLKKSILQEAVQGKLVPQDPTDEPASVLLERIRAEKEQLIKDGKMKKDKHESVIFRRDNSHYEKLDGIERCIEDEIPFEIPDGWEWCRLKTVGITQTGNTPSKAHPEYIGEDIPFITPGDIQNGHIFYDNQALSVEGKMVARVCDKGSILQVCIGGSIGKSSITDKEVCFNQQINVISPIIVYSEYLYTIIQSPYFITNMKEQAGGTATPIINRGLWDSLLIPVAPLSEQYRIVEKQRELFDRITLI